MNNPNASIENLSVSNNAGFWTSATLKTFKQPFKMTSHNLLNAVENFVYKSLTDWFVCNFGFFFGGALGRCFLEKFSVNLSDKISDNKNAKTIQKHVKAL